MEKLKTATGKTFSCDYFNPFPQASQVNIRILSVPLVNVVSTFSNPEETEKLIYGNQTLYDHTKLIAVIPEGNAVRVVLGKE